MNSSEIYDKRYGQGGYRTSATGYERARWDALRHFITTRPLPNSKRVLDYGAGSGLHIPLWRDVFPESAIYACDISRVALQQLHKNYPDVVFRVIDDRAPFESGYFDIVTSIEVIEHVIDLGLFLSDVRRLLRRGGRFIWTTPCANVGSIEHFWAFMTRQIDTTPDGSRRWRWEDSTHLRRLRTSEIKDVLTHHGFGDIRIRMRSHLFSWMCTKFCRGPLRSLREPLTTLDYRLLRSLPNGASMIGEATAVCMDHGGNSIVNETS